MAQISNLILGQQQLKCVSSGVVAKQIKRKHRSLLIRGYINRLGN